MTKKIDKGALVALPHDVEGFAPKRHLVKEDGQEASVGEQLAWKVIEFSKTNKKVVLSHTAVFSKAEEHSDTSQPKADKRSHASGFTAVEKSTLGDIEALAKLKEKIDAASERAE